MTLLSAVMITSLSWLMAPVLSLPMWMIWQDSKREKMDFVMWYIFGMVALLDLIWLVMCVIHTLALVGRFV